MKKSNEQSKDPGLLAQTKDIRLFKEKDESAEKNRIPTCHEVIEKSHFEMEDPTPWNEWAELEKKKGLRK